MELPDLEFEWSRPEDSFNDTSHPPGRQGSALCLLKGFLYLFGGRVEGRHRLYLNDLYRRKEGTLELWEKIEFEEDEKIPSKRHNHTLVALKDVAYLFGGAMHGELDKKTKRFEQVYLNDVWSLNEEGKWKEMEIDGGPCRRHQHTMVVYDKDKCVMFGGFGEKKYLNDLWVFDGVGWSEIVAVGEVPKARAQHSACVLNGRMYVYGGYYYSGKEVYMGLSIYLSVYKSQSNNLDDLYSISLHDFCWKKHETRNIPSPRNRATFVCFRNQLIIFNGNYYANKRGTDEWYNGECHLLKVEEEVMWKTKKFNEYSPSQSHMAVAMKEEEGVVYCFGGEIKSNRKHSLHILTIK